MLARLRALDKPAVALTLTIGAIGGWLAHLAHLPLGYMLGALVFAGVVALAGWRPFGHALAMPLWLRMGFVPVIGVSIGGAFTPQVVHEALDWGWSLAALFLYIPLAHGLGYLIYVKGGLPKDAAFFGAVPGGLIDSVQLGEAMGVDVRLLTVLQFLRLILTIVSIPLAFWLLTGQAVGSASGVSMASASMPLGMADAAILLGCAVLGPFGARALRIPAWIITGPLALSCLVHGMGWVSGQPPTWLIAVTQIVLGTGLGARFAGVDGSMMRRAGLLALVNAAAAMALAFGFAIALHVVVEEPVSAVFLAFAPGGLAEMSLIALSLKMSAIYVTAHHVLRIVLAVSVAQIGARFLRRNA
jgi:uncharacterized protein